MNVIIASFFPPSRVIKSFLSSSVQKSDFSLLQREVTYMKRERDRTAFIGTEVFLGFQ